MFNAVIDGLVDGFDECNITHIVGPEARGFIFGPMVACRLGLPFIPARRAGKYLPGRTVGALTAPDWEGKQVRYEMSADSIPAGAVIGIVDDWLTTGNHVRAIANIVRSFGADVCGLSCIVTDGVDGLASEGIRASYLLCWNEATSEFSPLDEQRSRSRSVGPQC
nr:phosphoribosyltransferase family protein [Tessaracoccus sp. MC1679]